MLPSFDSMPASDRNVSRRATSACKEGTSLAARRASFVSSTASLNLRRQALNRDFHEPASLREATSAQRSSSARASAASARARSRSALARSRSYSERKSRGVRSGTDTGHDRMVRGRRRYATIGNANAMTIPEARRAARRLIASYIEPAKNADSPKTPGRPMTAFVEEFLDRQGRRWKPRTRDTNARIVRKDILPAFGRLTVDAITVEHVKDWFASMSDRPGVANRAMPVLSMMMRMAELWGYRRHNSNPCRNTRRYRMKPMDRFLTADEMARLNAVLTRDEFWCPNVVAIVRLLMLTGCRFGEIASLEWDWIKDKRIHLPDSKSGPRTAWLSSAARAVIDAIPRYSADCPYLFPNRPPTRPIDNIAFHWDRIGNEQVCPVCGFTTSDTAGLRSPR